MKTRKSILSVILLMLTLTTAFCMSVSAASAKKKLVKSYEEYDATGKLTYEWTSTFNSKGDETGYAYAQYKDGKVEYSGKVRYKLTYWKGSQYLKKSVTTGSDYSEIATYNKKGHLKKVEYSSDGMKQTSTYKNNGRSSVSVDQTGRVVSKSTYDGKGNMTLHTYYQPDGTSSTTRYTNSYYKDGTLKKRVINMDSRKVIINYDKNGITIKRQEIENGKTTTTTFKNKYDKAGYVTKQTYYKDGQLMGSIVYKYTAKAYLVD